MNDDYMIFYDSYNREGAIYGLDDLYCYGLYCFRTDNGVEHARVNIGFQIFSNGTVHPMHVHFADGYTEYGTHIIAETVSVASSYWLHERNIKDVQDLRMEALKEMHHFWGCFFPIPQCY